MDLKLNIKKQIEEFNNNAPPNPVVSVLIFTYQQKSFINECIDSILAQKTNFPIEIIIGEDDSTDGTRKICLEYAKRYPNKIRLILHRKENKININGKITGRFNLLYNLSISYGNYIALCDGDDYWRDNLKLQKQVDFLEANKDFSICGHKVKRKYDVPKNYYEEFLGGEEGVYDIHDLIQENFIPTASAVMRREYIAQLPVWFYTNPAGDWSLFLLCAMHGKIKMLKDAMAVYRIHNNGIWSDNENDEKNKKILGILNEYEKYLPADLTPGIQKHIRRSNARIAVDELRDHNFSALQDYFKKSFPIESTEHEHLINSIILHLNSQKSEIEQLRYTISQYKTSTSYKLGNSIVRIYKKFRKKHS